jgi:hypothetical protein
LWWWRNQSLMCHFWGCFCCTSSSRCFRLCVYKCWFTICLVGELIDNSFSGKNSTLNF